MMILYSSAREYWALKITTTPVTAPADWEASFDGGSTWVTATDGSTVRTDLTGYSVWLLAGKDADPTGAAAVVTASMTPKVRLVANAELVVRDTPRIQCV